MYRKVIAGITFIFMVAVLGTIVRAQESETISPDDIPDPLPLIDEGEWDIVNVLLMGTDTSNSRNSGRTDVLMIVSINRSANSVSMLSIPRDLYVYIPEYRVYRINSAFAYGEQNLGEGRGTQLLIETIRYNLGIDIDFWARVDFEGFRRLVDDLGGIEVAVDCAIQDWRLIDPELDPVDEASWEMYTLPVGIHQLDGSMALWYARSRRTSSDLDRGRRHQALIRALWRRISSLQLFDQVRDVYPQILDVVDTNMTIEDILGFLPLATEIDTSRMSSYTFRTNLEIRSWRSPEGSSVLAPIREGIVPLIEQMYQPPTSSQVVSEGATIEVVNATGIRDMDRVAADRLSWEGFVPTLGSPAPQYQNYSIIYDFTGQTKGSSLGRLQAVLRVSDESVIIEPDPNRTVDFRVVLGGTYYACTHGVMPPQTFTDDD